jgi:hypothetical protein
MSPRIWKPRISERYWRSSLGFERRYRLCRSRLICAANGASNGLAGNANREEGPHDAPPLLNLSDTVLC